MMEKKFEINDILNAVNSISKIEGKKDRTIEIKNDSAEINDVLTLSNQAKSDASGVLVLDRMIE